MPSPGILVVFLLLFIGTDAINDMSGGSVDVGDTRDELNNDMSSTLIAASRTKRRACSTNGDLAASTNPRYYFECVHGSWLERSAPAGTVFDKSINGFKHASRAKRSACSTTGQLRTNSNPRKYEECVYGSWMVRDAPAGTEFDPAINGFVHAGTRNGGHSSAPAVAPHTSDHRPAGSGGFHYTDNDVEVLKKTIWLEARGESQDGQIAVAHVIKNRARENQPIFGGGTIAGVCLKNQQFECWNNKKPSDVHPRGDGYENMDGWVRRVLNGQIADNTHGALYYNNPDKEGYPGWTNKVNRGVKIGNHQFYTKRTGAHY